MSTRRRSGSALLMAIWTILVLSVLVVSFAFEAKLQSAANVYVRERVHMDRLIEAGRVLGEMIIANHQSVPDYEEGEDLEELMEDDRWIQEKRQLKMTGSSVTIGPIQVDEGDPEEDKPEVQTGTVTIQIESVGGGEGGGPKFNINRLWPGDGKQPTDPHYAEIWENILCWVGVPEDDQEYFVNSWIDWIDSDDVMKGEYGDDRTAGGEKEYYEDVCKETRGKNGSDVEEEVYKPRNGAIFDLKELAKVGAFRLHPAVLTGGKYYPEDEVKDEDNFVITNTLDKVLDCFSGEKINVNTASKDVLMCIPGIRSTDDPQDSSDAELIAQAIVDWRGGMDMNGLEVNLDNEEDGTLIKDFSKLTEITSGEINNTAQEYLAYTGGQGDGTRYIITIVAESVGMRHVVKAKMTLKDSKPVYLEWQEDP